MKLRGLSILFLLCLIAVLQATVINRIQLFSVKPDILLISLIFFSVTYGELYGLCVGAACGLFQEFTSGITSGAAVFGFSLGGLLLGRLFRWVYSRRAVSQFCATFVFTLAVYLFLFLAFRVQGVNLETADTLRYIILPSALYTALVCPVFFRLFKIIFACPTKG